MRILALETSGIGGSIALADGVRTLRETPLPAGQRSARTLAPTIRQTLLDCGWKLADVEVIAVTVGPGSFTGLRVGVVTAKTLAYVTGCQIAAVNTLEALAQQAATPGGEITTILDAQRGEYFAASWRMNAAGELEPLEPSRIVSLEELLQGTRGTLAGPVVTRLADQLPKTIRRITIEPQASAVATLGDRLAQRGEITDPFALVPFYLRRTAAEEQWDERQRRAR